MDLDSLHIRCGGALYTIPLDPPLSSLKEARERVVQMDKEAIAELGRSEVTVKEYRSPKGFHAVVFGLCLFTYVVFSRRANVLPGSLIYDYLLNYVPGSSYFAGIQPAVLWLTVGIHLAEAVVMARRLGRHSVPLLSRLWWTWVGSCFIEGYGSFQRWSLPHEVLKNYWINGVLQGCCTGTGEGEAEALRLRPQRAGRRTL